MLAVTVTLNFPSAEETVSMEVADVADGESGTLAGLRATVARLGGTVAARFTIPENPFDPSILIVEVPVDPELIVSDAGLPDTEKLGVGTVTTILVEWEVIE